MNAKHTPGPWYATPHRLAAHGETTLCFWDVSGPPREADAYLIAAAPELMEALELMRDTFCHAAAKSDAGSDAWNAARAAIAKAKGQQ